MMKLLDSATSLWCHKGRIPTASEVKDFSRVCTSLAGSLWHILLLGHAHWTWELKRGIYILSEVISGRAEDIEDIAIIPTLQCFGLNALPV